jgi:hypothetical protein
MKVTGLDIIIEENKGMVEAYIKGKKRKIQANTEGRYLSLRDFNANPSLYTRGLVPLGALDAYLTNQHKDNIVGGQFIF